MRIKELLAIGTIVRLKNGEKKLMIIGVKQSNMDENGKEYDYIGVLYPEGYLGAEFQYLFYQDDIEEIFFKGYEDLERADFIERLSKLYEE